MPQIQEVILDGNAPQERVLNRTPEQLVHVSVPQIMMGIVELTQRAPHERVHERVVGQIGDVPEPQITEGIVDGMHHVPQERVPQLRKKRIFLDWPRRPASQPNTGKVKCTRESVHCEDASSSW